MPNLVGTGLNQVPTNSMLGGLAYQDPEHASIKNLDLKNLSQINSEIADTAVDVFVYDTSKDSDGGAWRKRTQNTSWYNETLGTATRGSRKEFPAVAVIVAESNPNKITVYDGDDPDLPMWMVFSTSTGSGSTTANFLAIAGQTLSSISIINGDLCIGFPSGNGWGICRVNFVSDSQGWYWSAANIYKQVKNTVAGRNAQNGYYNTYSGISGLPNASVNDVAMTLLPNAPVDSATGLPIPTIAVATNGGTSVIKDDGTVFDFNDSLGGTRPSLKVGILGNDIVYWNINNGTMQRHFNALLATADSTNDVKYNYTGSGGNASCENVSALLRDSGDGPYPIIPRDSNSLATGAQPGMSIFVDGTDRTFSTNSATITDSRVAYITSNYNTGWMHGDIKGAFLSDTDVEDDVELVTNGSFSSDTSWTKESGWSITGGVARWTQGGGSHGKLSQTITLEGGKNYIVTVDVVDGASNGDVWVEVRDTNISGTVRLQQNIGAGAATGTKTFTFTAGTSTSVLIIHSYSQDTFDADNVSMKLTNDIIIGTSLIANGDFSSSSTAAFTTVAGGTATVTGGLLKLTDTTGSFCYASAPFATVIGNQYYFTVDIVNNSNTAPSNYIRCGNSHNGTEFHNTNYGTSYGTKTFYFTATATTTYLTLITGHGAGNPFGHWDNIFVYKLDNDRSVNAKGLQPYGTITKTPVATGADLVGYSGWSASNYLMRPITTDDIPTSDGWSLSLWIKTSNSSLTNQVIWSIRDSGNSSTWLQFWFSGSTVITFGQDSGTRATSSVGYADGQWHCYTGTKSSTTIALYKDGVLLNSAANTVVQSLPATAQFRIGQHYDGLYPVDGSIALLRYSRSAPTAEQVKKMYEDEKFLFQENAKATLYGSSDAVTALAYDEVTDQLHVGTSAGRSDFQGLRRINNTTTAVTTAISAHDEFIIEQ